MTPRGSRQSTASSVITGASGSGPRARDMGATAVTIFLLLLVLAALLALAFVPSYLNQDVALVQEQIEEVLQPAEALAAEVELAQTRQMAALEAYLFSGEGRFRQQYRDAHRDETEAFAALRTLTQGMSFPTREAISRVTLLALPWHRGLEKVLNEVVSREAYMANWPTERARFDEILSATHALRQTLARENESGLARMAEARALQARITGFLVFFGILIPLLILLFLGWRLLTLMREAEAARRAATRARREGDALMEATGDGVLGMDGDGRCVFLNRAGAELLGYSTRLVVGRDVHELLHHSREDGTTIPRESCAILGAIRRGERISGRNEVIWAAGREPIPVQISVRPLREVGEGKGAVLTFTDMRAARAAEENLRAAVRARDEVLGIVSHDLRNPVGVIFSSASLLLEFELPPEKRREHIASIKRSAGRMNHLIQDLLDVARMEAGALRVTPNHFHLRELLDEARAYLGEAAEKKGVALEVRMPDPEAQVWGDRERVLQVLSNLLDNAVKFTAEGGRVELGGRGETPGGGTLLWVSDTGPGITAQDQERLFDRFWQVGRRDKRGAGLGLSIVKGLVEAHGGQVWVESEMGEGSTFLFFLPGKGEGAEEVTPSLRTTQPSNPSEPSPDS